MKNDICCMQINIKHKTKLNIKQQEYDLKKLVAASVAKLASQIYSYMSCKF